MPLTYFRLHFAKLLALLLAGCPIASQCQQLEKVVFDAKDPADGYYLALRPRSNTIKGVLILLDSFTTPEAMFAETKLPNVAYGNDLLTVLVSMKQKVYADTATSQRLSALLQHVARTYQADTARFALVGHAFSGNIALRYVELTRAQPAHFSIRPRAVVAIDSPVDLFSLWRWCERQLKHPSDRVGDARALLALMTKEQGLPTANATRYQALTPFRQEDETPGNERFLQRVPVRLYYDTSLEWPSTHEPRSVYDTNIPEGSELIRRLVAAGNPQAELQRPTQPGRRSNGTLNPGAWSIVEEVACVHWLKNKLNIFDARTWEPPYAFAAPPTWQIERFAMPPEFAPQVAYTGVEDVRFAPGWADAKSPQYWSYAYVWWLDGLQKLNTERLRQHLHDYYSGLVSRNVAGKTAPPTPDVRVQLKPSKTEPTDGATYRGSIQMFDYMARQPITLRCIVHLKTCPAPQHTVVLVEMSPQPYVHPVWQELTRMTSHFECLTSL